jgi:hypothetical protein
MTQIYSNRGSFSTSHKNYTSNRNIYGINSNDSNWRLT